MTTNSSVAEIIEPIRLIIWDLDETFWAGTISEGGIRSYIEENHALVRNLTTRGIMNSICSKNDYSVVKKILQEQHLWEYFIFPSIDWSSKGHRVANIIELVGLRPSTVLFIDDNPSNRAEVAEVATGIVIADERFVPLIAEHPMFMGKDDSKLVRLKQYKLLERKKEDEIRSAGDNLTFLRACGIQVTFEYDVERHIDRVIELINRTNQLNFTKSRLSDDQQLAREEALRQVRFFGHLSGLVKASDRYGDYGYVGFFLKTLDEGMHAGTLKHFCFSCRTLGMGVEQWVYQKLGKPWLHIVGEVVSQIHESPTVDWINQAQGSVENGHKLRSFLEVRLRGGCEIAALSHYFKVSAPVTCVETNFPVDIFIIKQDVSSSLVNSLSKNSDVTKSLMELQIPVDALKTEFFQPISGNALLVLNLWGEIHVPRYRHKRHGHFVHVVVQNFIEGTEDNHSGDLTAWSDQALHARADREKLSDDSRSRLFLIVNTLRKDYTFSGQIDKQGLKSNLRTIVESVPTRAQLAIVLPSCFEHTGATNLRNKLYRNWCIQELSNLENVHLIDIDQCIGDKSERHAEFGDHFDRIVYFRLAEYIMRTVTP